MPVRAEHRWHPDDPARRVALLRFLSGKPRFPVDASD
jgi:hypothetical protein